MNTYGREALRDAFVAAGLRPGDLVYLSTRLFGVGRMIGVRGREEFLESYFDALMGILGPQGTLVVPTFTQQVGRFGVPFVYEETVSQTGIFGEYVRRRPDSLRSLHPVFSVTAAGALKEAVCADISPVAFGRDSAFDRMVRRAGKAVCIGFDYYSGHIVSLMHYVETLFAVPYYYNKLVLAPVWRGGQRLDREFVINVIYRDLDCDYRYQRYIDFLAARGRIRSAPIGETFVYAVNLTDVVDDGIALLKDDVYAFLNRRPRYRPAAIPADGPERAGRPPAETTNWAGYYVGIE